MSRLWCMFLAVLLSIQNAQAETQQIHAAPVLNDQEVQSLIAQFAPTVPAGARAAFAMRDASAPAMVAAAKDLADRRSKQTIVISVSALVRPSEDPDTAILVEIVTYDYAAGTGRILVVERASGKVRSDRSVRGDNIPVHALEIEAARRVALRDTKVAAELRAARNAGGQDARLEFPGFAAAASDALHGHRLFEIYFRTPRGYYISKRQFLVDLTENRIVTRSE
jgi:hypothetical protein